ncbi:hypothetical protein THAOC_30612, partial [Thalassiosira oceanica]
MFVISGGGRLEKEKQPLQQAEINEMSDATGATLLVRAIVATIQEAMRSAQEDPKRVESQ